MPSLLKRPHTAVIDLTGDDLPIGPSPKRHASSSHRSSGQSSRQPHSSQGRTLPSSQAFVSRAAASSGPQPDEAELIDLSQDNEGPTREFYGSLDAQIVGVRYYNGYASAGEVVICAREPNNQYDPNAIRMTNVLDQQIGHLPRKAAAKIAPYMDRADIAVEAVLTGEKGYYECPVRLDIYGPSAPAARQTLEGSLKRDRLLTATALKKGKAEAEARRKATELINSRTNFGPGSRQEDPIVISMDDVIRESQAVNVQREAGAVKAIAVSEDDLAKMPMAEQPTELQSQLLPYQLQGLAWMTSQESPKLPPKGSKESVQLWKWHVNGRDMVNLATNFLISGQANLFSGGILADDMGLGKTLQVISLILTTSGSGPTLIVAPVSVMSNWQQQIERHVKKKRIPKVLVYHTSQAGSEKCKLDSYDVVITSYGKLARDKDGGHLMSTKWRRVVLDEGHTIRNPKTNVAKAACGLKAQSRWVLTGTPIVNNLKDLQSMLAFLHMKGGVEQPTIFNRVIGRPLASGDKSANALLQKIMADVCLRRRKDMKFIDLNLPPKTEYVHRVTFREDEQRKYNTLLDEAKGALAEYQNSGNVQFQNVLERLLRLRQTCNHWTLCRERVAELLKMLENEAVVELSDENKEILQQALQLFVESQEDCPVCFDTLSSPVITHCKHVYCKTCITRTIELQHTCPMCRNRLEVENLLEPPPETSGAEEGFDAETKSSKTEALLKILQATFQDAGSKVIIFSQWTSFLNIIQAQLVEAGYKFTRIDGSMKADKRDAAIAALDDDPDTKIMLASLAVCSVGLNLVAADTVILADSWWAPAIEDQAVDRVHRLGQTRPTKIWRLVMENTVEERVLDIQAQKRELVGKAFREKGKDNKKETRMADVLKLLG